MGEVKEYPVRVLFVYDSTRYEVLVTLDFGVFVKKTIRLRDTTDFPSGSSGDPREVMEFRAAKKLAMDLALGKAAFARIEETRKNLWAELLVVGGLDGIESKDVSGLGCFDVASALRKARENGFDVSKLGWSVSNG